MPKNNIFIFNKKTVPLQRLLTPNLHHYGYSTHNYIQ
jgi:hypothetical protein